MWIRAPDADDIPSSRHQTVAQKEEPMLATEHIQDGFTIIGEKLTYSNVREDHDDQSRSLVLWEEGEKSLDTKVETQDESQGIGILEEDSKNSSRSDDLSIIPDQLTGSLLDDLPSTPSSSPERVVSPEMPPLVTQEIKTDAAVEEVAKDTEVLEDSSRGSAGIPTTVMTPQEENGLRLSDAIIFFFCVTGCFAIADRFCDPQPAAQPATYLRASGFAANQVDSAPVAKDAGALLDLAPTRENSIAVEDKLQQVLEAETRATARLLDLEMAPEQFVEGNTDDEAAGPTPQPMEGFLFDVFSRTMHEQIEEASTAKKVPDDTPMIPQVRVHQSILQVRTVDLNPHEPFQAEEEFQPDATLVNCSFDEDSTSGEIALANPAVTTEEDASTSWSFWLDFIVRLIMVLMTGAFLTSSAVPLGKMQNPKLTAFDEVHMLLRECRTKLRRNGRKSRRKATKTLYKGFDLSNYERLSVDDLQRVLLCFDKEKLSGNKQTFICTLANSYCEFLNGLTKPQIQCLLKAHGINMSCNGNKKADMVKRLVEAAF